MTGFVYFLVADTVEAVKIGFSRYHPAERIRALQLGCPLPLKIVAYVEGSMDEECALHDAFSELRIHTEWFRLEGSLRYLIEQLSHGRASDQPAHRPILTNFLSRTLSPDLKEHLDRLTCRTTTPANPGNYGNINKNIALKNRSRSGQESQIPVEEVGSGLSCARVCAHTHTPPLQGEGDECRGQGGLC